MLRHILPTQQVTLPQDFRPLVKVCRGPTGSVGARRDHSARMEGPMEYVTSGPATPSPMPPSSMVFPTGGSFYPPGRYAAAIDKESVLRTLDRQLDSWCETDQYIPSPASSLYVSGSTLPDRKAVSNAFVSELAMPKALLRLNKETCRSHNDTDYYERSGRLFNNPTKQDRYGASKFYAAKEGLPKGEPMVHGGVFRPATTTQAQDSRRQYLQKKGDMMFMANPFPQPGGAAASERPVSRTPMKTGGISVVGVATSGSAAPVW